MPTKRRRRPQPRNELLTVELRRFLETGQYRDADGGFGHGIYVLGGHVLRGHFAALRPFWAEHGPEIAEAWTAEHPGSRPAAWWWLEASAPRAVVRGEALLWWPGSPMAATLWRRNFGRPAFAQCRPRGYRNLPAVESQASYLARLNLLAAEERLALADGAFEPEDINPFVVDAGEVDRLLARGARR
jgi:hypothetical protein